MKFLVSTVVILGGAGFAVYILSATALSESKGFPITITQMG